MSSEHENGNVTGGAAQVEQVLRASELSYRRLFEAARDGILILDVDTGRITDANPFLFELLGFSRDEMVGKTVGELSPFKDIVSNQAMLERLQKDGYVRYENLPLETRDGRKIAVEFVSNVYQAGDKKVIQCNVRDITERRWMETALIHFRSLVESSNDAIMGKDLDGIITSWNTGAEKIFGYTADEMLGTSIMRLIPDDRQEEESKVLEKIHRGESLDNLETLRRTKSGKLISVSVTVCPIRDINGKIIGVSKVAHDITERKLAEQALGASEMMLEEIINAIPARVFWKDKNLAYLGCNAAFARDAGFAGPKDIVRKDDYQMGWRDQAEKYRADDREVIESGCAKLFMEESLTTSEGNTITLLTSKTPLRNSKREIIGMLGTYIDITVRLKLEQQLRQSQKMEGIGLLASGVAHDFNNILAVIQMQSDLLKTEAGITPAQSETAVEIGKAVQRASALTHQLLLFSRKQMLQLRDLDLNGSINEMIKMLRRTLGDDIQLQFKFSMQPTFVHADAVMMDQVLMNLALNARDAMPKGGQLIIETSIVEFDETAASHSAQIRPGKFVCLSVGDTGCGIPRENLQKIFEPFFTTKEVGKGTGLGLATVFGIVQQHNGWIDVYSEVGHGTTFRIYLPRLDKTSDQKFVSPATEPVRGGDETILLVEDEPRLRASVKNILSRLGYNVLDAANGVEALEVWKKHRNEVHFAQKVWNQQRDEIHLLLTDMVMPGGITGIGLAERLLKDNPKLKVIYASGYSAEVAGKDFPLQEGVNFLTKPFQAQKLAQTVRQSLDTKI